DPNHPGTAHLGLAAKHAPIQPAKESIVAPKAHTSKAIALVLSCAAQFMVVLDIAIVNVALPSIQQELGISQSSLQWIVIAYGPMLGGFLLPSAALSILAVTFTEGAQRNRALGIHGAVTGISASVGVIASGLLTDGPGWRWVFLIN